MAEKRKTTQEESSSATQAVLVPCNAMPKAENVCDMCGHVNPGDVAICKMCSNYLRGIK